MERLPLILKTLLICLFLSCVHSNGQAQTLQVTVTVTPPYSVHLQDYIYEGENVFMIVTNLSREPQQYKLIPSVTGDNGVSVTFKPSYQPASPIQIGPNETQMLTLDQLKQYNSNITENDVDVVGYSTSQLIQTESLPEGNYTLCVQAFDYNTMEPLSSEFSCASFPITHFDPPELITPPHESQVTPQLPQMVNFTWTPSGFPGITRYAFELVDMTINNLADPNDAFINQAVQPYVVQDIITSTLIYDLSYPALIEGNRYAVRITAYDPDGNLAYKNLGRSPVSTFTYGSDELLFEAEVLEPVIEIEDLGFQDNQQPVQVDLNNGDLDILMNPPVQQDEPIMEDPEDTPGCIGNCNVPAPPNSGNMELEINDEVVFGKFVMTVTALNGNNSGEGRIFVNWLKTPVDVVFNNLSVNNQMQVYSGSAYAKVDGGGISDQLAQNKNANLNQLQGNLGTLKNFIQDVNRRVSNFAPNNNVPIGVPFALDNDDFSLAIVGLIFEPTSAYMNAVLPVQIPEAVDQGYLSIHSSGICIRPNGLGGEGQITLGQDVSVDLSNYVELTFNANQTYLEFDCEGVTSAHVDGEMVFDRDLLLPVVGGNIQGGNAKVSASFSVEIEQDHNWMVENASLSPSDFTTPATRGFIFSASNIKFDHSDLANPAGMQNAFPNNYPNTSNTWKGLYIQNISCELPEGFEQGNNPLTVEANHLFIDKFGFTGEINGQDLVDFNSGELDGWKFSLDDFDLNVLNSGLQSGSFAGDIRLPISETAIGYDVTISAPQDDNSTVDFEFILEDLPDLEVNMWQAELVLENSTISVEKQGDNYSVGATLNGYISLGWGSGDNLNNSSASSFNLPSVEFSGLEIGGGNVPSIQNGSFGIVNNMQGSCATFPITLSEINFNFNGPEVGIKFVELGFTLANMENGLSGNADFTIWGEWKGNQGLYKYDRTQLNAIHIEADLVAATIVGDIEIYQEDQVYGNGFRGHVSATVNMTGTAIDITLQAGKTIGQNPYRYFYFDGLVDMGNFGIPLGASGVALYGFGGGMWYNMSRSSQYSEANPMSVDEYDGGGYNEDVGSSESGVVYTPSKNKVGFKASVLFGLYPTRNVFNGDVEFGMQMDVADLSLELVYMSGNGYIMQTPTGDRDVGSSVIAATVDIVIEPQKPMFHCLAAIEVNLGNVVEAGAALELHFETLPDDSKLWYVKVGKWNEQSVAAQDEPWEDDMRFRIEVDLKVVQAVFHGYFMVGNDIPGLPPLPKVIRDNLGIISDDRDPLVGNNPALGLAMGAGIYVDIELEFAIFYADVEFAFGADVIIKDFGQVECGDIDPIGINGWYAKGQAYGYFHGEAGLFVDLWFFEGKASLLSLTATAALFAQGPKPMYAKGMVAIHGEIFNGLIKVNTQFVVEAGEKCDLPEYNPFDDIPIVSEVVPSDGEQDVYTAADMQVAFNFPKDEFTLEEYDEEGEVTIRSFKYEIKKWELKHGNTILPWQNHSYAADGYSRKSIQKDYMPGEANIDYYMLVKGYETTSGKVEKASQVYQGSFKTGPRPDHIELSNVKAMQPMGGKRFVLEDEYDQGYIKLKKGVGYLFSPGSIGSGLNDYQARFRVLATDQVSGETNVTWNGMDNKVVFGMPGSLANQNIYGVEIMRYHTPPISDFQAATNTVDTYEDYYLQANEGSGIQGMVMTNLNIPPPDPDPQQINNIQMNPNQNGNGMQQMVLNAQLINNNQVNNIQPVQAQFINQNENNQGMGMNNLPLLNNQPPPPPPNDWQIADGFMQGGDGQQGPKIQVLNRKIVDETTSNKEEFNLFTYYWRTSKYDSWSEKLYQAEFMDIGQGEEHGFQVEWIGSNAIVQTKVNIAYLQLDENIDQYDAFGFTYNIGNNNYDIAPGISFRFEYGQNWLEYQWGDSYGYPWDAPDPEDWGNPITLQDEYGEPIQYDLDQFPDFDAYWPDKFLDWVEDRFVDAFKGAPLFDKEYPVPQGYKGWEEDPPLEFYRQSDHGIFNLQENETLPAANLSQSEVQAAMAQAPDPNPPPPWQQLQINNGGGNNQPFNMNMDYQAIEYARIPIIEYQDWIADNDFQWFKQFILDQLDDALDSQGQGTYWEFHGTVYEPILFFISDDDFGLYARPDMTNSIYVNDKFLQYKTKM